MDYIDIYIAIASVATIAVAGVVIVFLLNLIFILYDIKKLSRLARKEAEIIAKGIEKGASIFGSELSDQAKGFVQTVFSVLLAQFANSHKKKKTKKSI